MEGDRLHVTGDINYDYLQVRDSSVRRDLSDVGAMATVSDRSVAILIWNYHDLDTIRPAESVQVNISSIKAEQLRFTHFRIDNDHSNAYEVWKAMGSPQNPSKEQYQTLELESELGTLGEPSTLSTNNGRIEVTATLPGQAVSLLYFEILE